MIQITHEPIDAASVLAAVSDNNAGANLLFVGTTREWTSGTRTVELRYECYEPMAERQLTGLCHNARSRWNLTGVAVVHRVGVVPPGEASLAVAVSSPHRLASFEAGQWLIDRIKQVVPVWKQEIDEDGQGHWVHPVDTNETIVGHFPPTDKVRT